MCKKPLTPYYSYFLDIILLTFPLSLSFRIVFDFLFSLFILSLLVVLFSSSQRSRTHNRN